MNDLLTEPATERKLKSKEGDLSLHLVRKDKSNLKENKGRNGRAKRHQQIVPREGEGGNTERLYSIDEQQKDGPLRF